MIRIICLGNRDEGSDAAGPRVYGQLAKRNLPDDVTIVDGGRSGIDLLDVVRECTKVIFVAGVKGFGKPGEVMLIEDPAQAFARSDHSTHGSGLPDLLSTIDHSVDGTGPEILVVGLEPPVTGTALWRAAELSLVVADRVARPQQLGPQAVQAFIA